MKIELLVEHYSNATGFKLIGAGVHEVDAAKGAYLLKTFPTWFKAADADAETVRDAGTVKSTGTDEQTDKAGESKEAEAKPISKYNKTELRAKADELSVAYTEEMTNKELIAAIQAHQEAA